MRTGFSSLILENGPQFIHPKGLHSFCSLCYNVRKSSFFAHIAPAGCINIYLFPFIERINIFFAPVIKALRTLR
jgi:hypothetical protein